MRLPCLSSHIPNEKILVGGGDSLFPNASLHGTPTTMGLNFLFSVKEGCQGSPIPYLYLKLAN